MSYQPHNFQPGAVLLAEQLNEMDNEIARMSGGEGVLSENVKQSLLECFENVAWINDQGQTYYDNLYNALYPPLNIESISAVFDSGSNVIYDNMTLDDLRQYLTVIATLTDYSTQTVTDYVLSGNMTAGNQTITVSYGGKTTTFTVTVAEWLTSITAVFTQGSATIYDTDSLDTLKQYLVVTANYSDSTTAIVTDYTLSGTLVEGTSTITVSYGGKTDVFNVTVTADTNMFDPETSPDVNLYITTTNNTIAQNSSDNYHTTYVAIEPNASYKITKIVSSAFRIGLTEVEPVVGTSVLYTVANHSGTEIIVNVTQPKAAYLVIVYAANVTNAVNEQIRDSIVIEKLETNLWLFVNGYALGKATTGTYQNKVYRLSTSARASGVLPIENNGYVFTVTDSSKYNLAAYDVTSLDKITPVPSSAVDGFCYQGGTKSISWKESDSVTSEYVWLSLKKMDNTAFTDEELANGASAVFTYTENS